MSPCNREFSVFFGVVVSKQFYLDLEVEVPPNEIRRSASCEISSFILLRMVLLILLTILNLGLWYLLTAKLHRTC